MFLPLTGDDGLSYEYRAPESADGFTFVCFNPLTGDKAMWEGGIGPALTEQGHGLLTWNLRGQADSPFTAGEITPGNVVADALALLQTVQPQNPVYVGLSVGGLFAAKLHLGDFGEGGGDAWPCRGFVFINTLREIGPRLAWVNAALVRLAETGGLDLLRDAYSPLLLGEGWQAENRENFLKPGSYEPLSEADGAWHLLKAGEETVWDVDWSRLTVPVLNITGLQDQIFRDDAVIERLLADFQDVQAVAYDDAGHMVPAETPERLAGDLLKFVAGL
ncbi:MAG: alpha/beta hydrolase [Rhodospirillales bacterium]|nr:alpha/beta hydrolase [Alphaproteobacteria bacterium]MBL6948828.1 alpha/beta hydrolase [Rhodospirillales bacterium]